MSQQRGTFVVITLTVVLLALLVAIARHTSTGQPIGSGVTYVDAHAAWVALIAGLHFAAMLAARRKRIKTALNDSWLAPTPGAALTKNATLTLAVLVAPIVQLCLAILLLFLLEAVIPDSTTALQRLMRVVAGGALGGMLVGAIFSTSKNRNRYPGSRYVPRTKSSNTRDVAVGLSALSHWPIARTLAWATPDTVRWPVMAAMMSVMSGASIVNGLSVVGFWILVLYASMLCTSTIRVAEEAAEWLRATSLSFASFATAIGVRSLVHQLLANALLVTFLSFDKLTVLQALLFTSPWIAFVLVCYSVAISHSFSRISHTRLTIAASTLILVVAEFVHRGAAIAIALAFSAWQIGRGVRTPSRSVTA